MRIGYGRVPTRGPLQLSLFDEQDLAEITSDDFPGERLIACRNPALAGKRARTRESMLTATKQELGKLAAGRLKDPGKIALRAGKVLNKRKMAKQHRRRQRRQPEHHLAPRPGFHRRRGATDGIYVIRTPLPEDTLGAAVTVAACKDLKHVEPARPRQPGHPRPALGLRPGQGLPPQDRPR